jgi:hypothetical protein
LRQIPEIENTTILRPATGLDEFLAIQHPGNQLFRVWHGREE